MRPVAVDLFCCGGGAARGLHNAGFDVFGIDIESQPYYPFPFMQADIRGIRPNFLKEFDFVWASPPCQRYTMNAKQKGTSELHPDLIAPVRDLLLETGLPFCIENVETAPLRRDLFLCGSMFGLRLIRHRIFEVHGFDVPQPEHRSHHPWAVTVTGNTGGSSVRDGAARFGKIADWKAAMKIDWLPSSKIKEAIPPPYAEWIGIAALEELSRGSSDAKVPGDPREIVI